MAACVHEWDEERQVIDNNNGNKSTTAKVAFNQTSRYSYTVNATCLHCGCWKGTLGNEVNQEIKKVSGVQLYVFHTLLWLREVRRVLRDDGIVWLNLGDSFSSGDRQGHGASVGDKQQTNRGMNGTADPRRPPQPAGYPAGSLLGIPWQVALAAVADGWVLRNDATFWKDAPMPESVKGSRHEKKRCVCVQPNRTYSGQQKATTNGHREHPSGGLTQAFPATKPNPVCPYCHGTGRLEEWVLHKGAWRHTRATESVFMLTKSMSYWSDGEAVREPHKPERLQRYNYGLYQTPDPFAIKGSRHDRVMAGMGNTESMGNAMNYAGRNPRNTLPEPPSATADLRALLQWLQAEAPDVLDAYHEAQHNPVNVLRPKPSPLNLDHYASFPPSLVEQLILESVPAKCCPTCGAGWSPLVQREDAVARPDNPNPVIPYHAHSDHTNGTGATTLHKTRPTTIHGYAPTCTHYCACVASACECGKLPPHAHTPGIVVDCFLGSGTTLLVARALGRRGIGIEASWGYVHDIARTRLGFTDLAAWEGDQSHGAARRPQQALDALPLFAYITASRKEEEL